MDERRMYELAERFLAAWNTQKMDRVLDCYTEDVEYLDPNTRGPVRGADAMRRYLGKLFGRWQMHWSFSRADLFAGGDGCSVLWRATFTLPGGAVEGFTHGVADYLVKPFAFERFRIATDRALLALRARHDDTLLTIPVGRGRKEFVPVRSILSLTADGDYVRVRTREKTLHTLGPLSKWEAELPSPPFVRIHRSHLANADHISKASGREIELLGERLPVGSTHAAALDAALKIRAGKAR